jgi:hypothetical protein
MTALILLRHRRFIWSTAMKQFSHNNSSANHHLDYEGKSYVFVIDRQGNGYCLCESDSGEAISREDPLMVTKGVVGDPAARNRAMGLDEEFSVEVTVPQTTADLIWEVWDELDERGRELPSALPHEQQQAREAKMDALLIPIIREHFHS